MTSSDSSDEPESDEISAEERQELIQELERKRSVSGITAVTVAFIGIVFSAFQMYIAARSFIVNFTVPVTGTQVNYSLQLLQANTLHVMFALLITFLLFPPTTGRGPISSRLARIVPAMRDSFGTSNPATRAAVGVRSAVRWFAVDVNGDRVTPLDLVFMLVALLTGIYTLTQFDEISSMRVFGLYSGRPIQEVYPFLELPAQAISAFGIPLADTSYAFLLGVAGVLLVLEATRRALGFYLMSLVASFIVYARFGYLIPQSAEFIGVLSIGPLGWDAIVQNLWYNVENGVFGVPVTVSVTFIYIFILFGAFLEMSGAGKWFIDLAYSMTARRKGGPAKASILSSGFMGTISGSSIANTVTTGAFTIPLMKRSGYRPEFAGAVEASASSGGQILPPVMGAAAFLIVEFTGTPFADVIVAAAIPAIVFFFGVWVMVHLEASRAGIGGAETEDIVNVFSHLRSGWFYLMPLVLLLYYLLVERLTVARSAWFTLIAIIALISLIAAYNDRTRIPVVGTITAVFLAHFASYVFFGVGVLSVLTGDRAAGIPVSDAVFAAAGDLGVITILVSAVTLLLVPRLNAPMLDYDDQVDESRQTVASVVNRPKLAGNEAFGLLTFVLKSMDDGARTATTVVIAVAAAGIIPGVISVTGLGPNLTALIKTVAGGSIILLLLVTAVSCIILGMGMPTTVTYIILVAMLGPAIQSPEFGITILAAHLFILYFGVIADITPPVAVAAYAASGIAQSDQFETGVQAFLLSLNKAIVPFAFVLSPGLLLLRSENGSHRVVGLADVLDLGYFLPEVVVPVAGVFAGVVALGVTVIGYYYTNVTRVERVVFAVAALLLMAPGLAVGTLALFGLFGEGAAKLSLTADIALRVMGAVLFVAFTVKNKREAAHADTTATTPA